VATREAWIPFSYYALMKVSGRSGVYEIADREESTVYIGSAQNLRARIEKHLMEPETSHIKRHAALIRVEYRDDYEVQEKQLRSLFRSIYGGEPRCNLESDRGRS
jgi:excinuclease UvrABC nuclease subunit